jgi:putative ATP-binding cassette transporter
MLKAIWTKVDKKSIAFWGTALGLALATEIVLTCLIPMWKEMFGDMLAKKDLVGFQHSLGYYFILTFGFGVAQGLKTWLARKLAFIIRTAGSKILLKSWIQSKKKLKNYSQPMTDSMQIWTELSLANFVEIAISASIIVGLVIANLNSHLILIAALVYTLILSAAAMFFNKPLITSDMHRQEAEGIYRESISAIAHDQGDFTSKLKFKNLYFIYGRYIAIQMYFTLFSRVKGALGMLVPYIVLAPLYFSGDMSLGGYMAGAATFELIVLNSTILLEIYPQYTKMKAGYKISKEFYDEVR